MEEDLYTEFLKSGACENCGSQRCDQSLEWIIGCPKWNDFINECAEI